MCKEGSLSKRKLSNSKLHVIIPSIGHLKYANAVFLVTDIDALSFNSA